MTFIITGDWQCSIQNLDRCLIMKNQILKLLKACKKEKTYFLHLGDIKESHNPVDVRVTNFIVESFQEIKELCTEVFFVKGNHDMISAQDGVTSCIPLISSLGVTVADDKWIKIHLGILTLYMVPYVRNLENQKQMFIEAAADAKYLKGPKILAFHQTVTGCKQNLYSTGVGVNVNDLGAKEYDVCVGGHIHIAQKMAPNIIYVATPFPMTWAEANSDHRILKITI